MSVTQALDHVFCFNVSDLLNFSVVELVHAEVAEGAVQMQQLQGLGTQPATSEEGRQPRHQQQLRGEQPLG